jgi:D-alanyl-D-alanine carboxypeptidase
MGSVALLHNNKVIYTNAIGYDDIKTKKKSTISSKYRIGSISKTYTSVLILKAIEENKLTLEQTIEHYFPTVKNASKITIAQLLQHRSGIHNFTKDKTFFDYHTQYKSPQEMLAMISNFDSDFEPNSDAAYSNSNYFLLSQILEKVYDLPYDEIIKEKITTPLKLINTYEGSKISLAGNEANSYKYNAKWEKLNETDMSITLGAGSIVATSADVAKFIAALFNGKLLSKQSVEKMQTIKDSFGMGLVRYTIADRKGFGHRGTLDGFKSTAIYFPKDDLGLVIASNGSKDNINTIFADVLDLYFDDAPIEISEAEVKKHSGVYSAEKNKADKMHFTHDKNILVHVIKNEFHEPLVYKGDNRFVFEQIYAESISFTFSTDGKQLIFEQGDFQGTYIKEDL